MARVDLLAVGEAFEDLVFVGLPHLPAPGEEVKTSRFTQTFGGGAVRTAVAAARLGISARVVSALSTGAVAFLKSEKVAVRNLREPNEPHAITAALSARDNRSFVTFNGVNDVLEPRLLQAMRGELARHIHFALSPHNCGRWLPILRNMRDHDVAISWDFGWNPPLLEDEDLNTLVGLLDFLFVNEQEAMLYSRRETLAEAIAFWKARTANLILKQGAKGSRWISPEMDLFGRPRRVKSVDTTGAGHAYNGAFLCARLRGFSPEASLRLANFVWAMATRFPGGIAGIPRHGLD